ncbi:unnamed protein product [Taenia asiatica]|uniref:WD_REPEATS_REGION domain-containing protein n=1 Tax=Taenia asiatica TaxID=60517 RepID=A0A0R3W7L2_TAEAS|nr:unnamed protein product [Taenia asiatica]
MSRYWLRTVVFQALVPPKFLTTNQAAPSSTYSPNECSSYSLGKVITAHMPSVRFDKVMRKGLKMTQFDFEKAFYNQEFRLNREKLLKKSCKVCVGDTLDLVVREENENTYGKRVVLNAAKMLHTFSELEFCSEPWTRFPKQFQLNDAFLLNLDSSNYGKSDQVFSRNFRIGIIYSSKPTMKSKPLFAQMRGSHLGFTGSDAFEKINVSLLVPDFDPSQSPCTGQNCETHTFDGCLSLAAPTKLFPHFQLFLMEATEDSFAVAQRLGHINVSQDDQYLPLEHRLPPAEAVALESIELKKKARLIQVSTEDIEVKYYLRQLGEPICLFGEDGADRRERLRMFLAVSGGPAQRPILDQSDAKNSTLTARDKQKLRFFLCPAVLYASVCWQNNTVWYHQGPEGLAEARMWIAKYSLAQAKQRLERSKRYYASVPEPQRKARYQEYLKILRSTALLCSQVGDARPLTCCRFSPDGEVLATTSLSGLCRLWSVTNCELQLSLRGHQSGACCIAWHPQARLQPNLQIALASSAQDGSVKLWSLDNEEPLADIEGHAPYRVSRIAFHPSGRFLGTTCFDSSWRLWDLEVCVEILHQEGHSKPVYDIAFHPDGSLALTAGLDSYGRVWDLRTGRCIMFLEGHLEEVLGVDIAANGYHAASSSAENCVRIWDLRQQQTIYVIPAHTSVVSSVKFEPGSHNYLVTSSFDKTIKLWGHPLWSPIRTLEGHSGRCVYADISPDKKLIASASHDLTFKLWSPHTDEHN